VHRRVFVKAALSLLPVAGGAALAQVGRAPLSMRGITTESFRFCLETMTRSLAYTESRVTRINQDLPFWTILSHNMNAG
jgi:hypothetical protein